MQRGGVGVGIGGGGSVDGRSVGPVTTVGPGAGRDVGLEVSGGTLPVEVTPGNAGAGALPELPPELLQRRYR